MLTMSSRLHDLCRSETRVLPSTRYSRNYHYGKGLRGLMRTFLCWWSHSVAWLKQKLFWSGQHPYDRAMPHGPSILSIIDASEFLECSQSLAQSPLRPLPLACVVFDVDIPRLGLLLSAWKEKSNSPTSSLVLLYLC